MTAYYNEFDPYAAQWLRNLIAAGLIAPGEVDERSITDVQPEDLAGFTQCHFFAGIGGWSLAARLAGWADDRPLWTGSCPCQPFSVAGKGGGQKDERHLWPAFAALIGARRPDVVMGEQVAAAVGKDWLDGVQSDLEGIGYASRAVVVPACAVDAPHRRDRLWFVADAHGGRNRPGHAWPDKRPVSRGDGEGNAGASRDAESFGWSPYGSEPYTDDAATVLERGGEPSGELVSHRPGQLVDSDGERREERREERRGAKPVREEQSSPQCAGGGAGSGSIALADADTGDCDGWADEPERGTQRRNATWWAGAEWTVGADGKARRFEPGIRLLAHGVPARVGKLRAFGNAIVPQVAAEIIGAYMDAYDHG